MTTGRPIPVFGNGTTRRDYTYIDDILSGILAATEYDRSQFEVINLGESQTIELHSLVATIENALGTRAILDWQPAQPGDVPVTYADIGKARRLLGYEPKTNLETGIQKFAEWFMYRQRHVESCRKELAAMT